MVDRLPYSRIVIDANVLVAYLKGPEGEKPPERGEIAKDIVLAAIEGTIQVYLPTIALGEVIYGGERTDEGRQAVDDLMGGSVWNWVSVDAALARRARDLVRDTAIRNGVDALYVATGQVAEVDRVLTWNSKDVPEAVYGTVACCEPYYVGQKRLDVD